MQLYENEMLLCFWQKRIITMPQEKEAGMLLWDLRVMEENIIIFK